MILFQKYQKVLPRRSQIYFPRVLVLHPSLEAHEALLPFFSFQSWECEDTS